MKRILAIAVVVLISLFSLSAFISADDPFNLFLEKLESYTEKTNQEKVHLHLDKPYYAIGDDIWFKAYVVDTKNATPSTLSKILYVELINEKDSIKSQLKLPLESGITWGDFKLSDTLAEGNYRIRAYTQWMRNAGPDFFFDKTIKIGNAWANDVFTKTTNLFKTEGNTKNIISTITFTDKDGKPYGNAAVNYEVTINHKIIARGKTTTTDDGKAVISINDKQTDLHQTGSISATITIEKQKITKNIPIKATSNAVDVQFLPESGSLVEGLPGRVGIKAINANGLGENIKGTIVDNEGAEILNFETTHLGMGSIFLNPMQDKSYTAKVRFADGSERAFPLPKIEKSGYVMTVNNIDSTKLSVKIMMSPNLTNQGELQFIVHHNGRVYFVSKVPTAKQIVTLLINKQELQSGITQLTLLSSTNIPIAERIIFVDNPNDKINIAVQNLKPTYSKRSKVDLTLTAQNKNNPIQGSFSVAVTNATIVSPDIENETNILTELLLTSDLVGYIEKPNTYFLDNSPTTKAHLDELLLTQGWRKINWKAISNGQPEAAIVFQPEKSMKISGKITKGGKPLANGRVSVFSTSNGFFVIDTVSNAKGEFIFDDIVFSDSTKFVVQARTDKNNKNVQIDLDIIPGQVVTKNPNNGDIEIDVNDVLMTYLKQNNNYLEEQYKSGFLNKTILLKEVKVVGKNNVSPNSQNLNGPGNADAVITAKDLQNNFSASQALQGRVAGVLVMNGKAYMSRAGGRNPMTIVLDGMPMGPDFTLDDLIVQDIETIEVLKSINNTAIYGFNGGNGVLVVTTKRGGSTNDYNRYSPGIITYSPKGYTLSREFYSPNYEVQTPSKADLRTTVYWNPHMVSDSTGKAVLNYYNTDQSGKYRVVIEGIDSEGNLARKAFTYEVN